MPLLVQALGQARSVEKQTSALRMGTWEDSHRNAPSQQRPTKPERACSCGRLTRLLQIAHNRPGGIPRWLQSVEPQTHVPGGAVPRGSRGNPKEGGRRVPKGFVVEDDARTESRS